MIKILTTRTWRKLLARIARLEEEVRELTIRSGQKSNKQRIKVKSLERDIQELRKEIEQIKKNK